jgi:hypothetical protein
MMPISRRNKPRKTTRCPACAGTGYIDRKPIETKSIEQQLSEKMKDKIIEVYTNPETVQPKSISQEEMITEISNIDNYIKSIFK